MLSQRHEAKRRARVDPRSAARAHQLPRCVTASSHDRPIPSPINLGLVSLATASTESISTEIWAAVTAATDFGMQESPVIDKEMEINSQFGLRMRLEWKIHFILLDSVWRSWEKYDEHSRPVQ